MIGANPAGAVMRPLTSKEMQTLECVAEGKSDKEIARALGVSINTIKTRMVTVLLKTQAVNRTHAVAQGFRSGLLKVAP